VLFLIIPITIFTVYAFSFATGLLWLAAVRPTSGLVVQMFGLRYLGTIYGIVFLIHQIMPEHQLVLMCNAQKPYSYHL